MFVGCEMGNWEINEIERDTWRSIIHNKPFYNSVSGDNMIKLKLEELKIIQERLEEAERVVNDFRSRKWDLVTELKNLGHDFTATTEGMDVVLSAPPSMRF